MSLPQDRRMWVCSCILKNIIIWIDLCDPFLPPPPIFGPILQYQILSDHRPTHFQFETLRHQSPQMLWTEWRCMCLMLHYANYITLRRTLGTFIRETRNRKPMASRRPCCHINIYRCNQVNYAARLVPCVCASYAGGWCMMLVNNFWCDVASTICLGSNPRRRQTNPIVRFAYIHKDIYQYSLEQY